MAEAATLRKDIERQLTGPRAPAGLRERLAAAIEAEKRLTAAAQREQLLADAFRTRKEVLKGAYIAAQTQRLLAQAQDTGDDAASSPAVPPGRRPGLMRSPPGSSRSWAPRGRPRA